MKRRNSNISNASNSSRGKYYLLDNSPNFNTTKKRNVVLRQITKESYQDDFLKEVNEYKNTNIPSLTEINTKIEDSSQNVESNCNLSMSMISKEINLNNSILSIHSEINKLGINDKRKKKNNNLDLSTNENEENGDESKFADNGNSQNPIRKESLNLNRPSLNVNKFDDFDISKYMNKRDNDVDTPSSNNKKDEVLGRNNKKYSKFSNLVIGDKMGMKEKMDLGIVYKGRSQVKNKNNRLSNKFSTNNIFNLNKRLSSKGIDNIETPKKYDPNGTYNKSIIKFVEKNENHNHKISSKSDFYFLNKQKNFHEEQNNTTNVNVNESENKNKKINLSKMIKEQFNKLKIDNIGQKDRLDEICQDKYVRDKHEYVLEFQELNRNVGKFRIIF